jgi:hypothetical protein
MNSKQLSVICLLLATYQLSVAQESTPVQMSIESYVAPVPAKPVPVVVIQVNENYMELNVDESAKFVEGTMRHSKGISMISVMDANEGEDKYGIRSKDGLLVAEYKDIHKLPFDLQMKFKEIK